MELTEFGRCGDYLMRCGLDIQTFKQTYLINATDANGTVQSYYCTKQTAVFRQSNDKDAERRTVKNFPLNKFAYACKHPEALNW